MKKAVALLTAVCLCFALCACGGSGYGVKAIQTLVEQEYSIGFRNDDPKSYYVMAAIEVLNAEGKVDELSIKWFGKRCIDFESNPAALEGYEIPQGLDFIIGVDPESFPMVYVSNGTYWGFDIELAMAVADRLGWNLKIQEIQKENVYVELSSGNIDCAWGGVAINQKEVKSGKYAQFGPYIHNDIVVAARDGSTIWNKSRLNGKIMAMPSNTEAMDALESDPKLKTKLGQITRLVGGTIECFQYLYAGKCDAVLTDTTALEYYNSH